MLAKLEPVCPKLSTLVMCLPSATWCDWLAALSCLPGLILPLFRLKVTPLKLMLGMFGPTRLIGYIVTVI